MRGKWKWWKIEWVKTRWILFNQITDMTYRSIYRMRTWAHTLTHTQTHSTLSPFGRAIKTQFGFYSIRFQLELWRNTTNTMALDFIYGNSSKANCFVFEPSASGLVVGGVLREGSEIKWMEMSLKFQGTPLWIQLTLQRHAPFLFLLNNSKMILRKEPSQKQGSILDPKRKSTKVELVARWKSRQSTAVRAIECESNRVNFEMKTKYFNKICWLGVNRWWCDQVCVCALAGKTFRASIYLSSDCGSGSPACCCCWQTDDVLLDWCTKQDSQRVCQARAMTKSNQGNDNRHFIAKIFLEFSSDRCSFWYFLFISSLNYVIFELNFCDFVSERMCLLFGPECD